MEKQDYINQAKLQLFAGDVLNSEIDDNKFDEIVELSLAELNRYYNMTELKEIPVLNSCIDISEYPEIRCVVQLFRVEGVGGWTDSGTRDPIAVSQFQMFNAGSTYYANDWIHNYMQYALSQKLRNTMSTDLEFRQDPGSTKLYVNFSQGTPYRVTAEYIPNLVDCSQVKSAYWMDMLRRLVLAHSKIILGRIRTRYTQAQGAVWSDDGDKILTEGNDELKTIREKLNKGDYVFPLD